MTGNGNHNHTAYKNGDNWGMVSCFTHINDYLVGGLEHFLFFHHTGNVIIPTDELIFFRGVVLPPIDH